MPYCNNYWKKSIRLFCQKLKQLNFGYVLSELKVANGSRLLFPGWTDKWLNEQSVVVCLF